MFERREKKLENDDGCYTNMLQANETRSFNFIIYGVFKKVSVHFMEKHGEI